jgi:chemotaxis-related protein WspD
MQHDAESHTEGTDCWNAIGVLGNATCPELPRVVHCRNCPIYAAAGRQLLERKPAEAYLREWTDVLTREQEEVGSADTLSVLIFRLDTVWLALPTQVCKEVTEMRPIHTLPHRSGRILRGLVNIRGEILLCVSLGHLLGLAPAQEPDETKRQETCTRLVVMEKARDCWVFLADEIHGLHYFHPRALQPVPATADTARPAYTGGTLVWCDKSVGYLDPELLFTALHREVL